ncbi:MAG: hypothetical protein ACUVRF_10540, partial [Desulfotomaculales bacterium]
MFIDSRRSAHKIKGSPGTGPDSFAKLSGYLSHFLDHLQALSRGQLRKMPPDSLTLPETDCRHGLTPISIFPFGDPEALARLLL